MFVPIEKSSLHPYPRSEDPSDVRLAHYVQVVERSSENSVENAFERIQSGDVAVIGYPDDRGVDRNGGRLGASEAPNEIRNFLYKMTPPGDHALPTDFKIWDFGNLMCWSMDLLEAHDHARKLVAQLRKTGVRILSLGGGHDWAYPDYVDFQGHLINIDAHLDMRPLPSEPEKAGHSGTPFRRILTENKNPPHISAVGLQRHCNARAHLEFANGHRVTTFFAEEMPLTLSKQWELLSNKLELAKPSVNYAISIDLDAFPAASAPGVSAPQAVGVDPLLALELVRFLKKSTKQLGLYELAPRYDQDHRTARLAARFAYEFLMG